MLQSALVPCRQRSSLVGEVHLFRLVGSGVKFRALVVLNGKLVIEVDCLDLLGDHLDLILVTPFTANWEPFLDLDAMVRLLFLKRTLKHQVVPALH